jgi:hypothetical protein
MTSTSHTSQDNGNEKETINNFYWTPYTTAIVVGASKSGKTRLVSAIVQDWKHFMPGGRISKLSIMYAVWQPAYNDMINSLPPDTIIEVRKGLPDTNEDLPSEEDAAEENDINLEGSTRLARPVCRLIQKRMTTKPNNKSKHSKSEGTITPRNVLEDDHLLIIDDLIQPSTKNDFVLNLFNVLSHHSRVNVILLVQSLHGGGGHNNELIRSLAKSSDQIIVMQCFIALSTMGALQQTYFRGLGSYFVSTAREALEVQGYR